MLAANVKTMLAVLENHPSQLPRLMDALVNSASYRSADHDMYRHLWHLTQHPVFSPCVVTSLMMVLREENTTRAELLRQAVQHWPSSDLPDHIKADLAPLARVLCDPTRVDHFLLAVNLTRPSSNASYIIPLLSCYFSTEETEAVTRGVKAARDEEIEHWRLMVYLARECRKFIF